MFGFQGVCERESVSKEEHTWLHFLVWFWRHEFYVCTNCEEAETRVKERGGSDEGG